MRIYALALGLGLTCMCHADVLFYGGDYEGDATSLPITSQHGGAVKNTLLFDDFSVNSLSTVTGLFGMFILENGGHAQQAYYEVRKEVSEGNGGTLVASGTSSVSYVATGKAAFGKPEYRYTLEDLAYSSPPAHTGFQSPWTYLASQIRSVTSIRLTVTTVSALHSSTTSATSRVP